MRAIARINIRDHYGSKLKSVSVRYKTDRLLEFPEKFQYKRKKSIKQQR